MIRILLAEDEDAMRTYLARALENAGYSVAAVDRGTAAVPLLESEHFDLLLSDIVMPGTNGIELARRVHQSHPGLPVLLATGYSDDLLKGAATGFQVISKPYGPGTLAEAVATSLGIGAGK